MMKRRTMLALAMMGVVAVGSARAQGGMQAGGQLPDPDRVMQMMTAKLGLTADQQAKIAPVIADRRSRCGR